MTKSDAEAVFRLAADMAGQYRTDTIVILGKGPSADQIHSRVFRDAVVIGVNDAERIHPTDITVFYEDWVGESVAEDGLRSRAYVTSTSFQAPDRRVVRLPFRSLSNDAEDQVLLRFQARDEVVIEEAMFLTALEIARAVADHRGRRQTVYMVGFDFTPDAGQARAASSQYSPELSSKRRAGIELQEYILANALYALEDTNLDVQHVGTRKFSALTPELLNERYQVAVDESLVPDPVDYPDVELPTVEVTAEITTNHFGDLDRLERLVRASHAAGADWVKVQKRDVDTFYTSEQLASPYKSPFGSTFGDYRRQLELNKEGFLFLDELTKDLGIRWFASVLDKPSFEWMTGELDVPLVKLPSTISEKKDYLSHVAQNYTGSVVVSTGMTDRAYEEWLLETFTNQDTLYLLHCNSAYPTPDEHTNIGVVRHYAQLAAQQNGEPGPRIVPGYSSHDYGWMASALAVAAGAQMVEKHVKLGNTAWAHFDAVAVDLTTDQVMSIMRDTWVPIPGHGEAKINASMSLGGSAKTVSTLEELTGVRVDHVAAVDMQGFQNLVSAMDGVTVESPVSFTSRDDYVFHEGPQEMGPSEAMSFVRERKAFDDGDFQRVANQQALVEGVLDEVMTASTLTNPVKVHSMVSDFAPNMSVDSQLSDAEYIADLAWSMREIRGGDIEVFTIDNHGLGSVGTESIIVPDFEAFEEAGQAIREGRFDEYASRH